MLGRPKDGLDPVAGSAIGAGPAWVGLAWRLSLACRFSSTLCRCRIDWSHPCVLPEYENEWADKRPNRRS